MREPVLAHDAVLTAALTYAAHGWPVFPCNPLNKHPLTEHGFQNATTNEGQIRAWWAMWPQANVAFPTGSVSGIDVLDVDADHGGFESLAVLQQRVAEWPTTLCVRTGGGGRHFFFRHVEHCRNTTELDGLNGIDVRGDGGYVIAPPSLHASGQRYLWMVQPPTPVAPWPEAWLDVLPRRHAAASRKGRDPVSAVTTVLPEGQRNSALYTIARSLRARGLAPNAIDIVVMAVNVNLCVPPLEASEVKAIIASATTQPDRADFASKHRLGRNRASRVQVTVTLT